MSIYFIFIGLQNYLGWERPLKVIESYSLLRAGQTSNAGWLLRIFPTWGLNIFKDDNSTVFMGNMLQHLSILTLHLWKISSYYLVIISFVATSASCLSYQYFWEKKMSSSCLWSPNKELKKKIMSPLSSLFSRLKTESSAFPHVLQSFHNVDGSLLDLVQFCQSYFLYIELLHSIPQSTPQVDYQVLSRRDWGHNLTFSLCFY